MGVKASAPPVQSAALAFVFGAVAALILLENFISIITSSFSDKIKDEWQGAGEKKHRHQKRGL
jgi:hypothetical protein